MRKKTTLVSALLLLSVPLSLLPAAARAEETVLLSSLDLSKATQGYGKPQADKSIDGHLLTLHGQTFAHGFGTHAPSLLAVDLSGGSKRFTATVGVDDEVGVGHGNVEFEVLGDHHVILWRSGVMHEGDTPKTVDIDLSGVRQALLRVTTGGKALDSGHADWADAQFVTAGAKPETVTLPAGPDPVIWMAAPSAAPQIHPPLTVGIRPNTPFLWTVPVSGARPLTFTATGLPAGLSLNRRTGTISGILARPGTYPIQIGVRNAEGKDARSVRVVAGDSLALTPPMGWNSYDGFGDDVTEAEVLANAHYVAQHLQPLGWDTVVVDFRWYDPGTHSNPNHPWDRTGVPLTMDAYGRLLPSEDKFPSASHGQGFKPLADQVHAMGLKFGIHIMRGIPRNAVKADLPIQGSEFKTPAAADSSSLCRWCPDMYGVRGATPAGQAYYDSLLRLYASWGLDFIKVDDMSQPYHTDEIEAVRKAIDKCGRSIVLSLSPGATPLADAAHVEGHANMWRVAGDFWDLWPELNNEFGLGASWHGSVGQGHWPDADMLPVGHLSVSGRSVRQDRRTDFTRPEQVTLLSLWSLLPSPLMVGADLPDNDPWTLALLSNPEVLAINQDASGVPASRAASEGETEVWTRPLADGSLAVGLFNRDDFAGPVTAQWSDLHLTGHYTVRDLWQRKTLGVFTDQFTTAVPRHGAVLVRLQKAKSQ